MKRLRCSTRDELRPPPSCLIPVVPKGDVMEHRHEQLIVETTRHRITGTVTLARDGYRSRISDLLNATERDFVSLTDVTIETLDLDLPATQHPFVAINRHQIVFAVISGDAPPPASGSQAPPA